MASTVIGAGICTVLLGISTGRGLQEAIDHKVATFHGDLQVRGYQQALSADADALPMSDAGVIRMQSTPHGQSGAWHSACFKAGMATTHSQMLGAQLMGLSSLPERVSKSLVAGRLPAWPSNEVCLSREMARQLRLDVDSTFEMYFSRDPASLPTLRYYRVAGLYETGLFEWDERIIFVDERQVQKLNRWTSEQHQAWLFYGATEASDMDALRALLPLECDVYSPRQDFPQLYQWLDLFDTNTWILGIILTLVAAFNASVVVFIRVIERRKAVAILRAMGLSTGRLTQAMLALFSQSVLKGMLGGNLLALGLLWVQWSSQILPLDPQTYYVDHVPVSWDWSGFLLANLFIITAVLATSVLPAKILSKFHPSQVLRMA